MKLLNLCMMGALASITLAPNLAQAARPGAQPPTYGAYVEAFAGPNGGVDPQVIQNGVLPTPAYAGLPGVLSASGSGGGVTASADLATGDLSIVANSAPDGSTEAIAFIFTQLTFHGSGQGVISFGGTLSESGAAHAEEYVGVSSSLFFPEAGFSIPNAGAWSGSSTFSFFDGETLYAFAQISGGSENGGSLTITDPMSISMPEGTFYLADAPQFLIGGGVPEPGTWMLMLAGIGGVGLMLRSRPKSAMAAA